MRGDELSDGDKAGWRKTWDELGDEVRGDKLEVGKDREHESFGGM